MWTSSLPYEIERYEVIIHTDNIPAMGYKTLTIRKKSDFDRKMIFWHDMRKFTGNELMKSVNTMENENLKVIVENNGTITMVDKLNKKTYRNLNYFEETGDHGDYWIYYPPYHNRTYNSLGANAKIWYEENGELSATIVAEITMTVPKFGIKNENMVKGESKRSDEMTDITIACYYTLTKDAKALKVKTVINNTAQDHRMPNTTYGFRETV